MAATIAREELVHLIDNQHVDALEQVPHLAIGAPEHHVQRFWRGQEDIGCASR